MAKTEIDNMEYASDVTAQAAYVSDSSSNLQSYKEDTIKTQGSHSLKVVANTSASGKKLSHTLSPASDLTGVNNLKIDMYSNRTGENVKLSLLGSGGAASVTGGGPIEGYSFDFDGATIATLTSEITAGTNMTYSFWVKDATFAGGSFNTVMGKAGLTVGYVGLFYNNDFYVGAGINTEQILWSMSGYTYTEWNHYVIVKTDTSVELFINGVSKGAQYISTVAPIDSLGYAQTQYMDGLVDEINIWDRALSVVEVGQLYNGGKGLYADTSVAPFSTNLLYAWHMNEGTGSTLVDSVSANNGTINTGTPAWGSDKVLHYPRTTKKDKAISFNGSTNYIDLGVQSSLASNTMTVAFVLENKGTDKVGYIFDRDFYGDHWGQLAIVYEGSRLAVASGGEPGQTAITYANLNNGDHLAFAFNYPYCYVYQNGALVNTLTFTYEFNLYPGEKTVIGRAGTYDNYYFDGVLNEFCIWNRALSASEIGVIYNGKKGIYGDISLPVYNSGLVAAYHLDETTGTTITDFSGNGITGTLTGTLTSVAGTVEKEVPLTEVDGSYTTHTFLSSGTITTSADIDCEVLLVAGGGGGASGGGGAGGVIGSDTSLIAHYKANDTDGSTAVDSISANNGAGAYTSVAGKINTAFRFNGSSDYVRATDTNLPMGNSSRTMSCWFRKAGSTPDWVPIIAYGTAWTNYQNSMITIDATGNVGVNRWGSDLLSAGTDYGDGAWHLVVYTYNSATSVGNLYVDNVLKDTLTQALNTVSTGDFGIGRNYSTWGQDYFYGDLDDVRVYNKALSQAEMNVLFNSNLGTENNNKIITLAAGTHNVTVGSGGIGKANITSGGNHQGDNGLDSVLSTLTAVGGGGGANTGNTGYTAGEIGGSGGGGGSYSFSETFGGTGTAGQGNDGGGNANYLDGPYPSGGGGGWAAVGGDAKNSTDSGDGGAGDTHALLYNNFYVGGGGGGGTYGEGAGGSGGLGGGGKGPISFGTVNGDNGVPYTGGGGGGSCATSTGGTGGSGMIVIKYLTPATSIVSEFTPNIVIANQWQTINWNISAVSNSLKSSIPIFQIEIVDATSENTFYLDNFNISQTPFDIFGWVE